MGFIEGEGSFAIMVRDYKSVEGWSNNQTIPRLSISQKEKAVLEKIQTFFEGYDLATFLYLNKHTNTYQLSVSSHINCFKLEKLLKEQQWFTLTKKLSFDRWCNGLEMIRDKKHKTDRENFRLYCKTINKHQW